MISGRCNAPITTLTNAKLRRIHRSAIAADGSAAKWQAMVGWGRKASDRRRIVPHNRHCASGLAAWDQARMVWGWDRTLSCIGSTVVSDTHSGVPSGLWRLALLRMARRSPRTALLALAALAAAEERKAVLFLDASCPVVCMRRASSSSSRFCREVACRRGTEDALRVFCKFAYGTHRLSSAVSMAGRGAMGVGWHGTTRVRFG